MSEARTSAPERLLSEEDLAILALEGETVAGHTCKLTLLEHGANPEAVATRLVERADGVPELRLRLGQSSAGKPAWVGDEDFDPHRHIRLVVASEPIDETAIRTLAARAMEDRLDRDRPMWALDVVEGTKGRVALVWRIHHALADGSTVMRLARELIWDETAAPAAAPKKDGSPSPAKREHPLAPRRIAQVVRHELPHGHLHSPLEGDIGRARSAAFATVPFKTLHDAAKALAPGATVNDAVLSVVAGGLRRWLEATGRPLHEIRVRVPVSLHSAAHPDEGNRDSFFCVGLPVDDPDPVDRLRRIHAEAEERKHAGDARTLDSLLHGLAKVHADHIVERVAGSPRAFALSISNVPGPRDRPTVAGTPVDALYTLAEIGEKHALRVAVVSMAGTLYFGLCADPAIVSELDSLVEGIEADAEALVAAATG